MSILVACPQCGSKLKVPSKMAGQSVGCPKCARAIGVPAPADGLRPDIPVALPVSSSKAAPPVRRPSAPAVAYQAAPVMNQESVAVAEGRHSMGAGTLLALVLASGGAIIAVLVLGVALLRGKAGPAPEPGRSPVAVSERDENRGSAPAAEEPEERDPAPLIEAGADQPQETTQTKKKSKSSTSKKDSAKDSEGDDAPPASSSRADAGQRVYRSLLKSAVFIINFESLPKGRKVVTSGSGSLIDKANRLVLTNYHVVGDSPQVIVFFPEYKNRKLIAEKEVFFDKVREKSNPAPVGKVVARSPRTDLALVQLDALPENVAGLNFAKRSAVPGQRVHSIGNPGDSNALWIYTAGVVRQVSHKKWRAAGLGKIYDFDAQVVETQSPTNPGDSGGPLVNDQGDLIAVTEGHSREAQLMSTFIHVDEVRALLDSYNKGAGNRNENNGDSTSSKRRKGK